MPEKIALKLALNVFSKIQNPALAIVNSSHKIIWFNKNFKLSSEAKRIKNQNILKLFGLTFAPKSLSSKKINSFQILHNGIQKRISFVPLTADAIQEGFLVSVEDITTGNKSPILQETLEENLLFQQEMQHILAFLLKEKSLKSISNRIIERITFLSDSDFGLIYLNEKNAGTELYFYDPNSMIKSNSEFRKNISVNFSYINKWISINKRPLTVNNTTENIGYNLAQTLQCSSLIIAPCIFEDNILASIIVGKKHSNYKSFAASNVEQFALILAFAISSIRSRELNAALEVRLAQAQKLETIGKLSSGMAHDFNNLLSSIFGSLNLLKKRVPEREDITKLLENIENCSIRAKDLTKGLLSFGKPTPKRKELIKPNLLLLEISKVIKETFPKRISLKEYFAKNLYDILGNTTEIYQVLLNLAVNAKEAIVQSGEINLKAQNISVDDKNLIEYPLLSKGNYVWISVSDSGSGIDEENLIRIFDPYFSTKTNDTNSGSGLGLYVTYGIVKAHNGHIEVSSKIGEGTTFDVFIPSYEPTKILSSSNAEKIILLADDEIMLRDLLAELLESHGYSVIKVATGSEAIKVLTEEIKVDLAIIDYNMPEMNGLDCTRKIRELKFKFPIILSSGSLIINDNFDFSKYGANGMIAKPYEFELMLETIKKLF